MTAFSLNRQTVSIFFFAKKECPKCSQHYITIVCTRPEPGRYLCYQTQARPGSVWGSRANPGPVQTSSVVLEVVTDISEERTRLLHYSTTWLENPEALGRQMDTAVRTHSDSIFMNLFWMALIDCSSKAGWYYRVLSVQYVCCCLNLNHGRDGQIDRQAEILVNRVPDEGPERNGSCRTPKRNHCNLSVFPTSSIK